jgi:ParB family chromosome partitioning protein
MTLGRGLSSLIPDKKPKGSLTENKQDPRYKEAVLNIELIKIEPNPYQPRKHFKEEALNDLAESIKEHGVLQPIVVSEIVKDGNKKYQIIAGERRFRASKLAGLSSVPAILKNNKDDKEQLELAILENVQREDLTPIEKAFSYKRLADEFKMTHSEIAEKVGKNRATVSNTIRLIDLPEEVKKALEAGDISENHARAILSLPDNAMRLKLLNEIKINKLSARSAELTSRAMQKKQVRGAVNLSQEVKDILLSLEDYLGTKVTLNIKKNIKDGGDIVIKYFSNDDLKNILMKISKD